jgi:predicted RNA-binding protein with PIN domain
MAPRDAEPASAHQPTQSAKTLIDGYNLMFALGVTGKKRGSKALESSRTALLNVLADALPPEDAPRTVVVFDAQRPPPGLPRETRFREIVVYFASDHEDADELMEELIARHSAPRQLTVVSSDHRLQRAARRRKATASDSDVWFDNLLRRRNELRRPPRRPPTPDSGEENDVEFWLREFAGFTLPEVDVEPAPAKPPKSPRRSSSRKRKSGAKRNIPAPDDPLNIFPPGYGEDLLGDE